MLQEEIIGEEKNNWAERLTVFGITPNIAGNGSDNGHLSFEDLRRDALELVSAAREQADSFDWDEAIDVGNEELIRGLLTLPLFDVQTGVEGAMDIKSPWRDISWEQIERMLFAFPRLLPDLIGDIKRQFHLFRQDTAEIFKDFSRRIEACLWGAKTAGQRAARTGEAMDQMIVDLLGSNFGANQDWRHHRGIYADGLNPPPDFFPLQGEYGLKQFAQIAAVMNPELDAAKERAKERDPEGTVLVFDAATGNAFLTSLLNINGCSIALNDSNEVILGDAVNLVKEQGKAVEVVSLPGPIEEIQLDGDLRRLIEQHKVQQIVVLSNWGLSYLTLDKQIVTVDKLFALGDEAGISVTILVNALTEQAFRDPEALERQGKQYLIGRLKTALKGAAQEAKRANLARDPEVKRAAKAKQDELIAEARGIAYSVLSIRGPRNTWPINRRVERMSSGRLFFEMGLSFTKKRHKEGRYPGHKDFARELKTQCKFSPETEILPVLKHAGYTVEIVDDSIMFGNTCVYKITRQRQEQAQAA